MKLMGLGACGHDAFNHVGKPSHGIGCGKNPPRLERALLCPTCEHCRHLLYEVVE
jgi:hypothetical protein